MSRVVAVGVFDLLHAGHLHYLEQAKLLGDDLVVVVAHDDTVRQRKHEPVTSHDLRKRMVEGLKPVNSAIVGNPPSTPIFDILDDISPDIIALGYDQKHSIDAIREGLDSNGHGDVDVRARCHRHRRLHPCHRRRRHLRLIRLHLLRSSC